MLLVRKMEKSDVAALAELLLKVRRQTFHWVSSEKFQLNDFAAETENEIVFVAEDGVRIAGFISVWLPDHFIHHLFVAADGRQVGVGTALIQTAIELCRADGAHELRLKCATQNANACQFYERRGWVAETEAYDDVTGPYRNYVLRLPSNAGLG